MIGKLIDTTAKKATAAAGGSVVALTALMYVVWDDVKATRAEVHTIGERVARLEGRQEKLVEHIVWKDGDNEYTSELKK